MPPLTVHRLQGLYTVVSQGRLKAALPAAPVGLAAEKRQRWKGGDPQPGSRPCVGQVQGSLWDGFHPAPCRPKQGGTLGLRSEIPARLGLDSELPRQQAASVRSARTAGARRPLLGTSRHGDPGLISASPISAHPPRLDLPKQTRSLHSASQMLRCWRWGPARGRQPRPSMAPPTFRRPVSVRY